MQFFFINVANLLYPNKNWIHNHFKARVHFMLTKLNKDTKKLIERIQSFSPFDNSESSEELYDN